MIKKILIIFLLITQILYSQKQNDLSLKNLKGKVKSISVKNNEHQMEQLWFNLKGYIIKRIEFTFDNQIYSKSTFCYNSNNLITENKTQYFETDTISVTVEKRKYKNGRISQIEELTNGKTTSIENIFYDNSNKITKRVIKLENDTSEEVYEYKNANLISKKNYLNSELIGEERMKYKNRKIVEFVGFGYGETIEKIIYKYNSGKISEIQTYNYENKLTEIYKTEKNKNILTELFYNSNNELQTKWVSKFDNMNKLIEFTVFNQKNEIEKNEKHKLVYDKNSNVIKDIITDKQNNKNTIFTIDIEYYK